MKEKPLSLLNKKSILEKQYFFLKIYTFGWWASYSMAFVFQSLFFVKVGIRIDQVFFNSALSVLFSLTLINFWSKISDKLDKKKNFIVFSNILRVIAFFFLGYVNNFETMIIYTIIFYAGPNSDALLISYIYKIAEQLNPERNSKRPIFNKIRTYTDVRKFGSIGWAAMLPFSGLFINLFGFKVNFIISSLITLGITIFFIITFNEEKVKKLSEKRESVIVEDNFSLENTLVPGEIDFNAEDGKDTLLGSIKNIMKNEMYKIFIIVTFIAAISSSINSTIFSIFNSLFTSDYILLGLTWSVNAFIEYPVMNYVSKKAEKYSWQNIIVFTFLLSTIRLLLNPLLLFFNGNIYWIYVFQILNGFNFGLGWPATTLGLDLNVEKKQKSLGISFYNSIKLLGNFIGNLLGQIISITISDQNTFYNVLFIVAAIFSLVPAILLYYKTKFIKSKEGKI